MKDVGLVVDISPYYDIKRRALSAYKSQFTAPSGGNDQVATPLTQGYLDNVEARDRILGTSKQMAYAEGFIVKRPLTIDLF